MQLIQTLHEASALPIEDLKKVMSKDARVKAVFQKHLDLEDLSNKTEFLSTLKFFLLDNRNVLNFVDSRDWIRSISKARLKKLRETRPQELKQKDIDDLLAFVSELFREHSYVERSGMTPELRKEIMDWVNANGRYFDLSSSARKELASLPNIRPTRPVLLYRGLLFNSHDLRERKRYDGQIEVGKGLKFLRSVREGSRIVDLEWERASSWTTSKQVAMQFAKFGPAQSNFSATLQWLSRKAEIDGDLGFIVSTLAQPEDILIDVDRMVTTAHFKHGSEGEYILKPGTYTCRVSTKYTKSGEVDPIATGQADETVSNAAQAALDFAQTWERNPVFDEIAEEGWSGKNIDLERTLDKGNLEAFRKLASKGVKQSVIDLYGQLREFYKTHIVPLDPAKIETLMADPKHGKILMWVSSFVKSMSDEKRHKAHQTPNNSRGTVKKHELSAEQAREAAHTPIADGLKKIGVGRFTDSSISRLLNRLAKTFAPDAVDQDLHRRSGQDQQAAIDKIVAGFFSAMSIEPPADREEAIKKMANGLLAAERNAAMIREIEHQRSQLDDLLKSQAA